MEQAPLVYALVHALDRAITGEMVFRTPGGEAHTVTFFEGAPVRVEPGAEGERIGEDLVAMDHLQEDALAAALVASESSRARLGEILVQTGALDPAVLTRALTLQTVRRLAQLANLPPESTFSLYFSARAEPEPFAPWAPLDTLLAAIRAWTDRSRLHGTLRWLAGKRLELSPDANLADVLLTSREQDAVALMQRDPPSLKALYASVGKGLSSLLYMLTVTRQFSFSKGPPMGRRKTSDLVRDVVQVAAPIAPVITPAAGSSEPPPSADSQEPVPSHVLAKGRAAASPSSPPPPRPPPRPSYDALRAVDATRPPPAPQAPSPTGGATLSDALREAEQAAMHHDFESADRILRDECTDDDAAEPDFQALAAWVKANLSPADVTSPLNDLTFLLMSHHGCQSALYYRGLLLKRTGKPRAALRDFIGLAKKNPAHAGALAEIKLLRDAAKKS